jgi:hypothetical protein
MNSDGRGDIIQRMLRQLEEEERSPKGAPRCDGCGRRVELAPYQRRITDGGTETLFYCADCRAEAMIELVDESDL